MTDYGVGQNYHVGQKLWVYDVNGGSRGLDAGEVIKVGRKLVTVRYGHNYEHVFRIEDGRRNDNYGHQYLKTEQGRIDDERRAMLIDEIYEAGFEKRLRKRVSLAQLEAVAAALRELEQASDD